MLSENLHAGELEAFKTLFLSSRFKYRGLRFYFEFQVSDGESEVIFCLRGSVKENVRFYVGFQVQYGVSDVLPCISDSTWRCDVLDEV